MEDKIYQAMRATYYYGQVICTILGLLAFGFQALRSIYLGCHPVIVVLMFALVGTIYFLYGLSIRDLRKYRKSRRDNQH